MDGTDVALRKESVDRNARCLMYIVMQPSSLSARRAGIEIINVTYAKKFCLSLSARRAWIEIHGVRQFCFSGASLSARRAWIEMICAYKFQAHP